MITTLKKYTKLFILKMFRVTSFARVQELWKTGVAMPPPPPQIFKMEYQRRIQNPVKHLRWSVLELKAVIFAKLSILNVWQGSECASEHLYGIP